MTTPKMSRPDGAETTLLVLIVDRSGSMEAIREDMEGGIATLLAEQAAEKGTCLVTLAQFDSEYELIADAVPVAELLPYRLVPRDRTALLDAMGRTISMVRAKLEELAPEERPEKIVTAVITDGMENASREWSHLQVMDCVKARIAEGWHFTFLGANQDAIQEGGRVGIAGDASLSYSGARSREAVESMSTSLRRLRRNQARSLRYTDEERRRSTE
jgi:Mg-chelatase subunit ChlD